VGLDYAFDVLTTAVRDLYSASVEETTEDVWLFEVFVYERQELFPDICLHRLTVRRIEPGDHSAVVSSGFGGRRCFVGEVEMVPAFIQGLLVGVFGFVEFLCRTGD